jgi:ATP-dependent RNA helicase RhlE
LYCYLCKNLKHKALTFNDFNLNTPLLNALSDMGISKPTTIQQKAIPAVMSGTDLIGIAQTGTGKTLAYLLPCLRQWKFSKDRWPQILIVVPTRELVMQVANEVKKLTAYMNVKTVGVFGGANIKTQSQEVYNGLDVLVATPGRLFDIMMMGTLRLKTVKKLVIDEMDEMLNLGFRPQLVSILDALPQKRQNLMFSATLTEDVELFINDYFGVPKKIEAAPSGTPLEDISQSKYETPNYYTKVNLLKHLFKNEAEFTRVLVFTATKKLADQLFEQIESDYPEKIGVIHSNKAQNNRFNTVNKFQNGTYRILIATDIVARGIDVSEVSHVINFDVPEVPENYIHRIGRTGRADKKGNAISFVSDKEADYMERIQTLMNQQVDALEFPDDVEISTKLTRDEMPQEQMKEIPIRRPKIDEPGPAFHEKKEKNKKVNQKITRAQKMKQKYGKPISKGGKRR